MDKTKQVDECINALNRIQTAAGHWVRDKHYSYTALEKKPPTNFTMNSISHGDSPSYPEPCPMQPCVSGKTELPWKSVPTTYNHMIKQISFFPVAGDHQTVFSHPNTSLWFTAGPGEGHGAVRHCTDDKGPKSPVLPLVGLVPVYAKKQKGNGERCCLLNCLVI